MIDAVQFFVSLAAVGDTRGALNFLLASREATPFMAKENYRGGIKETVPLTSGSMSLRNIEPKCHHNSLPQVDCFECYMTVLNVL